MTLTRIGLAAGLVMTMVAVTACGLVGASPSAPIRSLEVVQTPDTTPDLTPDQTPGGPTPATVTLPASILDPILDDAAARSGVDRAELLVLRGEAVTWPDGGLGCPQPGVMYIQVLVDGYRVIVSADSQELDYRGDGRGNFRLCTSPDGDRHPSVDPGGGGGAI